MIEGLPNLKGFELDSNHRVTGNVNTLRVLRDTIEVVIKGDFMDLADFPRLQQLLLSHTNVSGDIRRIREVDFPALKGVYCLQYGKEELLAAHSWHG